MMRVPFIMVLSAAPHKRVYPEFPNKSNLPPQLPFCHAKARMEDVLRKRHMDKAQREALMPPATDETTGRWTKQIQAAIVETGAVREGLHDEDAIPFIDWGSARAAEIGARLVSPGTPEPNEEQVADRAYALTRLMTRMTWVVTYRQKKDANWLTRTFEKINELSREVYGPNAPTLSDQAITEWIAGHAAHTDGELLRDLMARLTPSAAVPTLPGRPGPSTETPGASPETPGTPAASNLSHMLGNLGALYDRDQAPPDRPTQGENTHD